MVIIVALAASLATFVGGSFALRFKDQLHLLLGFSAGAVAGVAFFDLLPSALDLNTGEYSARAIALAVSLGFFGYLILDRLVLLHTHADKDHVEASAPRRGVAGALTLAVHSFLDGIAIGLGFEVMPAVGVIIALAVLAHDFSDGINTVNLVLKDGGNRAQAMTWLLVDAAAPVTGVLLTLLISLPPDTVDLILAVFVGTFLYLSASDLIPESHHRHPRALTTCMTLLGAFMIWAVVSAV